MHIFIAKRFRVSQKKKSCNTSKLKVMGIYDPASGYSEKPPWIDPDTSERHQARMLEEHRREVEPKQQERRSLLLGALPDSALQRLCRKP